MYLNKLKPNIKIGCPLCSKLLQDELKSTSFQTSEPQYNKIVTIVGKKKKHSSKTVSLF